jgi:hypothetical protein
MLSLPVAAVDVGDEGDDARNWEASVSCTVVPLVGDLHWNLDVYLSKTILNPPSEPIAAAWLAERLHTVVAYEATPSPPSAYWLVGPDGRRTRARIYEEDSDDAVAYRIDAVEHPLSALPGLRVAALPEVIRNFRVPTPMTDRLREQWRSWLGQNEEAATVAKAVRDITTRMGAWESMVTRLEAGWPPDGWYPAEYYREDLETRDELAAITNELPEPVRGDVTQTLAEVDRRFIDATEDDRGQALATETGPAPIGSSGQSGDLDRWWWRRIPRPLPWRDAPSQSAPADNPDSARFGHP